MDTIPPKNSIIHRVVLHLKVFREHVFDQIKKKTVGRDIYVKFNYSLTLHRVYTGHYQRDAT